ncbi:MAG: exo-alpha-sialidase [Actinomycetaceae bacterium]|nr:exo-alpha-sialidase [Actinomycetaceae bacterium]
MRKAIACAAAGAMLLGTAAVAPFTAAIAVEDEPTSSQALTDLSDVAQWYDQIPGVSRYRIPALTQLNNGDLLAVFDLRPTLADLAANIGVAMRRSTDGGKTWGPIQTIHYEQAPKGEGDPSVLVERETGKVFVFYAGSINRGFAGSAAGNREDDPTTMTVHYSWSDDNGNTWHQERITEEVKDANWAGIFAASGEGIQMRVGEYAGRLVQQFVVKIDGKNHDVSLYSDDRGDTWQFGTPVNPNGGAGWGDENKVAELSDGTLMLNTRMGPRGVMLSKDGGETWDTSTFYRDWQQIDPYSNGAISRIYPDAEPGSPESKMLLLVNSEDFDIRHNDTAKVSCDDGKTWPGRIQIYEGASAYITPTPIKEAGEYNGKMGILFERDGYTKLTYTTLDTKAMGMVCAPVGVKDDLGKDPGRRLSLNAGEAATVNFTISNQTGSALAEGGTITVSGDYGWTPETVHEGVGAIAAGETLEVPVAVDVPATVAGDRMLTITYTSKAGEKSSQYVYVNVNRNGQPAHYDADVEAYLDAVYPEGAPGPIGDGAVPWVRLVNSGNVTVRVEATDNGQSTMDQYCMATLNPGDKITCKNRGAGEKSNRHTITEQDVANEKWQPTLTIKYGADVQHLDKTKSIELDALDLSVEPNNQAFIKTLETSEGSPVFLPTGDFKSSAMLRVNDSHINSWRLPNGYPLSLNAAKDNRTSAQLVVKPESSGTLTAEVSEDENVTWEVLYPEAIKRFTGSKYSKDLREAGVTTDPLRTEAPTVEAGQNQAIWFVAHVSPDASAGVTSQTITLKLDGEVIGTYPVHTEIYDKQLLPRENRPFILDLWWHPDAVADYYGVPVWSEEHFALMKPYLQELADAQQDVVNIVVNYDPWHLPAQNAPQTASHYNAAVKWSWDGSKYNFDFTNFDKLVDAHAEAGITGPIHIFSLLNFRQQERLTYFDETQGKEVTRIVELAGEDYNQAWGQFLRALEAHLKETGDFDRATLMFDEQGKYIMEKMMGMLESEAPNWQDKIALAANSLAEADIANFIAFNRDFLGNVSDELIEQRRDEGKTSLYYTWSQPVTPNVVTESPLVSARALGWIAQQKNLDGFLRWTFNSWPADVFNNPTHMYSQGDEYLVYPGGTKADPKVVSSMRWEAFQDGIDDAEILREAKNTVGVDEGEIARIFSTIKHDGGDTPQSWASMVNARTDALRLIGEQKDSAPRLTVKAESTEVTPGTPVKIKAILSAPRDAGLENATVKVNAPDGWQITPGLQEIGTLSAGRNQVIEFWVANNYGSGEGTFEFVATHSGGSLNQSIQLTGKEAEACQPVSFTEPSATSQETANEDNKVENAFDGDPNTIWHSKWSETNLESATVTVKTDAEPGQELCSFSYLMRQTGNNDNGKVRAFQVSTSEDGQTWSEPVLVNEAKNDRAWQHWNLPEGTTGPWVKIHITSRYSAQSFFGAAEFGVGKKIDTSRDVTVVDTVDTTVADLNATREFTIPENDIAYVANGKQLEAGTLKAAPGEKVTIRMNGLADHGYVLADDAPADWEHTFLKLDLSATDVEVAPKAKSELVTATLSAGNGGTVTYSLTQGAPEWLQIDSASGVITAVAPSEEGAYSAVVIATEEVAEAGGPVIPGTFTTASKLNISVKQTQPETSTEVGTEPNTDPSSGETEGTDGGSSGETTGSTTQATTGSTTQSTTGSTTQATTKQTDSTTQQTTVDTSKPSQSSGATDPSQPGESSPATTGTDQTTETTTEEASSQDVPSVDVSSDGTQTAGALSGDKPGKSGLAKTGTQVFALAFAGISLAFLGVSAVVLSRRKRL